jgi:hypothetical protein
MVKKDREASICSSSAKTSSVIAFGGPCLSHLDEFEQLLKKKDEFEQ